MAGAAAMTVDNTSSLPPCHGLPEEIQQSALLQLLSNSLILCHVTPYLSCFDVLSLAATSRTFRYLVYNTPQVFRRVDLTPVRIAQFDIPGIDHGGETWRNVQLDENLTEDDFYSGPLRGIFSNLRRSDILRDVQVLVLDGLSVTAELVHDILMDPSFSVRILSIRDVKNLNERKLRAALQYACRESRPEGMPRLRGLYVFGPKEASSPSPDALLLPPTTTAESSPRNRADGVAVGVAWNNRSQKALAASLVEEPEAWYVRRGDQFPRRISPEWAPTLVACAGIIAFDAVLCTGPYHLNSPAWGAVDSHSPGVAGSSTAATVPHYGVATYSLDGCASCGAAPEGWTVWGEDEVRDVGGGGERRSSGSGSSDIGRFPLLAPLPLHSASISVAMCPTGQAIRSRSASVAAAAASGKARKARFVPRCYDCLRDRHCSACNRWWCEACYRPWTMGGNQAGGHGGGAAADLVSNSHTNSSTGGGGGGSLDPKYKARVSKSCWECGMNCHDCIDYTQRTCARCGGGYCLIHNEGSTLKACDWCSGSGRRTCEFY